MTQTALMPEAGRGKPVLTRLRRWGPLGVTAAVAAANLWSLRATLTPVAYLDDASVHQQMVRYATSAFRDGRSPLSGWFPYLGLGSPQFLHYQSLGAMLTGLVGTVTGANTAFRWSLWLLLALWPFAIYASARLFRLSPWTAAAAALVSPLLASVPSVGFERGAYVWIGYGLWSQLWGMWVLPFAWATTWRAVGDRRFIAPAAICVSLTVAFHFETGYLALIGVVAFPWMVRRDLRDRVVRAAVVLGCALLISAWVVVPLLRYSKWAGINETLIGTPLENGYGAHRVLGWLITGRVFDNGHLPVVSVAVLIGVAACIVRWRRDLTGRALTIIGLLALLLCFGRTTFGPLIDIVPASHDLFFRRFMMGVQLAGIYLAGIGVVVVGRALTVGFERLGERIPGSPGCRPERPGAECQPERPGAECRPERPGAGRGGGGGRRLLAGAAPGGEQDRRLRPQQPDVDQRAAGRTERPVCPDRAADRLHQGPSRRANLRGDALELGDQVHGRRRTRLQVPGESGHR